MKYLTNEELYQVEGGGFSLALGVGIMALLVLAAGVLDGFTRPLKCNN